MTRTMLKEKCLPKNFWVEAVACIAYLLSQCPLKSVENMTPQEAWSGYKPSVTLKECLVVLHMLKCLRLRERSWMIVGRSLQTL